MQRAEELRTFLDGEEGGANTGNQGPSSSGSTMSRPKTKKNAEEKKDDENDKLRGGLDSAIVREKPNVSWDDVAGLDAGLKDRNLPVTPSFSTFSHTLSFFCLLFCKRLSVTQLRKL